MRSISLHEVEPGHRYRFTFRRPVIAGTRSRMLEGVLGASFWGEVPLHTKNGIVRIQRADVVRAYACV
jgi:hypothetical protein